MILWWKNYMGRVGMEWVLYIEYKTQKKKSEKIYCIFLNWEFTPMEFVCKEEFHYYSQSVHKAFVHLNTGGNDTRN